MQPTPVPGANPPPPAALPVANPVAALPVAYPVAGVMPTDSGVPRAVSVYTATGDHKIKDQKRTDDISAKFQEFKGLLGQIVNVRLANTGAIPLVSKDAFQVDLKMHSKVAEVQYVDAAGLAQVELIDLTQPSIAGSTASKALKVAQELQNHMVSMELVSAGGDLIAGVDYDEEHLYALAPRVGQDGFSASFAKMKGDDQTKLTLSQRDPGMRANLGYKFFNNTISHSDEMLLTKDIERDFTESEIRFIQQKRMLVQAKINLDAQLNGGGLQVNDEQRVRHDLKALDAQIAEVTETLGKRGVLYATICLTHIVDFAKTSGHPISKDEAYEKMVEMLSQTNGVGAKSYPYKKGKKKGRAVETLQKAHREIAAQITGLAFHRGTTTADKEGYRKFVTSKGVKWAHLGQIGTAMQLMGTATSSPERQANYASLFNMSQFSPHLADRLAETMSDINKHASSEAGKFDSLDLTLQNPLVMISNARRDALDAAEAAAHFTAAQHSTARANNEDVFRHDSYASADGSPVKRAPFTSTGHPNVARVNYV